MMDRRPGESTDFHIFKTAFYYCFVIIVLPVATFFGSKLVLFDGIFGLTNISSNVYSAIAAVIVLHVALGFFICRAYSDPTPVLKPAKQD